MLNYCKGKQIFNAYKPITLKSWGNYLKFINKGEKRKCSEISLLVERLNILLEKNKKTWVRDNQIVYKQLDKVHEKTKMYELHETKGLLYLQLQISF